MAQQALKRVNEGGAAISAVLQVELETIAGGHLNDEHRAESALAETLSPERQRMLSDSLLMEVGQTRNQYRERVQQLGQLREQAAQLTFLQCAAAEQISKRTEEVLAREDARAARGLIAEIATLIAAERKALATAAQRSALLSALTELGYEVREGMQTAWAKEGRVVLRRAAIPEMGVEIMTSQGAERLQFRPVRFGAATSAPGMASGHVSRIKRPDTRLPRPALRS